VSVEEAGAAQDGVADAAEVAALERPPGALEHGAVRGGAARDDLVGRERGLLAPAGLRPPPPPRLGRYPHRRRPRHPWPRGGGGSGDPRALRLPLAALVLRQRGEEPEPAGGRAGSGGEPEDVELEEIPAGGDGVGGGGGWRAGEQEVVHGGCSGSHHQYGRSPAMWRRSSSCMGGGMGGSGSGSGRGREGGRGGGRAAVIEGGLVAFLVLQTGPS
jgi:hypothetical protein